MRLNVYQFVPQISKNGFKNDLESYQAVVNDEKDLLYILPFFHLPRNKEIVYNFKLKCWFLFLDGVVESEFS